MLASTPLFSPGTAEEKLFKNSGNVVKALHERETFMRCWDVAHNRHHVTQVVWGYMVKRLSAFGGCLGGNRR